MKQVFIFLLLLMVSQLLCSQEAHLNFYELKAIQDAKYADPLRRDAAYKHYKRDEYYMQNRLEKNGDIVNVAARKWETWKKFSKAHAPQNAREYSGNWEFFGPFLIEENKGIGRVNRIAFHPTDPDIIYVATAGGGLLYTTTHGTYWTPLTESLPVNNISGVAIDYTDPDIIYILTGDGDGSGGSPRGYGLQKSSTGVLKSYDGGDTWQTTELVFDETDEVWPYDLVMHPTMPNILFAITSTAVFRTQDGGENWYETLNGEYYELHFKVDEPSTMFAVAQYNVWRSTTIGLTWDNIPIPLFQDSIAERMTMATCPSDPNVIYVAASPGIDSTVYRGLFVSTDGGQSFDLVSNTPNVMDNQGWYDLTMICHPADVNDLLLGVVTIFGSTDGGATMDTLGGTHADIHDFQINPLNNLLYVGNDGGIYYSDDFGQDWTFISEILPITQYYKIAVSQQNAEVVIGGTQDNGSNRNLTGATTVFDKILGKDGMDCAIHPLNDSLMIYSSQFGEFWISNTKGDNEDTLMNNGMLPASVGTPWVTPVAWDPADTNVIFLGYNPIYRSFDRGATFNPVPDTISGMRVLHVTAGSERLYAGDVYEIDEDVFEYQLWTSTDQGDSWSAIHTGSGFPDSSMVVSGLCTRPDDPEEVWICLGGWEENEKVYRSLDGGETWENMSGSLPNTPINAIILDDAPEHEVYIGTDIGVFYLDADLDDWIHFSNGLPIVEVTDLEINFAENKILAGTYGRGIWWGDLYTTCEDVIAVTPVMQHDGHSYFFQASDSVISNVPVDNSFGIQVQYRSGNVVQLTEGFQASAQYGSLFRVLLGECGDGGVPSVPLMVPTETILPVETKLVRADERKKED